MSTGCEKTAKLHYKVKTYLSSHIYCPAINFGPRCLMVLPCSHCTSQEVGDEEKAPFSGTKSRHSEYSTLREKHQANQSFHQRDVFFLNLEIKQFSGL